MVIEVPWKWEGWNRQIKKLMNQLCKSSLGLRSFCMAIVIKRAFGYDTDIEVYHNHKNWNNDRQENRCNWKLLHRFHCTPWGKEEKTPVGPWNCKIFQYSHHISWVTDPQRHQTKTQGALLVLADPSRGFIRVYKPANIWTKLQL